MAEIINLRSARKAKARLVAQRLADGNRAKHGRTKAQIAAEERERKRHQQALDDAKLEAED